MGKVNGFISLEQTETIARNLKFMKHGKTREKSLFVISNRSKSRFQSLRLKLSSVSMSRHKSPIYYCPMKDNRQVDDLDGQVPYQRIDSLSWTENKL